MRSISCLTSLLLLVACGGENPRAPVASVRDSAGVMIVENSGDGAVWEGGQAWAVADEPILDIGTLEGEEPYQLFQVSGAVRLPDGRIVVANSGTSELRFFDRSGRYAMSVGRKGSGPGEFEGLGTVGVIGDSIAAFDWNLRRISTFALDGTFLRSAQLQFPSGSPRPIGMFADGRWLCATNMVFAPAEMSTVRRDTSAYYVFGADGALVDSLFAFPSWEFFIKGSERFAMARSLPFGRGPAAATSGDGFWAGLTDRYELKRYASDGRLEVVMRRQHASKLVTDADIEAYKADALERIDNDNFRRQTEQLFQEMPIPSTMPAFAGIIVDELGDLWVADYTAPGAATRSWTVFDADGRMLGSFDLPGDLNVYQIGDDFILGLWRDELDVQHVRVYRLFRGERERES